MSERQLRNTELKQAFQNMSCSDLADWRVLSDFIFHKVGLSLNKNLGFDDGMKCWGEFVKCKQLPDELAQLLVFLYERRDEINSYCEIGAERFGTFCVIDSFLRAVNPNMGKSLAVDISNRHFHFVDLYIEENPLVSRLCANSQDFKPSETYDLCLIDGDHSYEGAKKDFDMMAKTSKYIALHDIVFTNPMCNVKKLWEEVKVKYAVEEWINKDPRFKTPLGIGVATLY